MGMGECKQAAEGTPWAAGHDQDKLPLQPSSQLPLSAWGPHRDYVTASQKRGVQDADGMRSWGVLGGEQQMQRPRALPF